MRTLIQFFIITSEYLHKIFCRNVLLKRAELSSKTAKVVSQKNELSSKQLVKVKQKNIVLRNLLDAHGWLGVSVSILLFLVFWAGAISLFRLEVQQWAELPHHPIQLNVASMPLMTIINNKLRQYPLNTKEHLTIYMPGDPSAYYRMSIDVLPKAGQSPTKEDVVEIDIDPKTGETLGLAERFGFSEFIFRLHYNLNIASTGLYLVGFFSLIFLVAIFSGVYIHWNKLASHFFAYRTGKLRTHLLDLHNLAGVMTLPYILMYAVTGLIFNLIIVFQIVAVVFIYQGNTQAVFKDVGRATYQATAQSGIPQDMSAAIPLIEKAESSLGSVRFVQFYNYGDQNAVIRVRGKQPAYFSHYYDVYYQVRDGVIVQQYGLPPHNAYRRGMEVVGALHFANFAGIDLRFLYFLLAMAVAAMIIAGNFLWIAKRANQSQYNLYTLVIGSLSVGGCGGIILATALGFLLERALPSDMSYRASIVIFSFTFSLLLTACCVFFVSDKKYFLSIVLVASAALLSLVLLCDLCIYAEPIAELVAAGHYTVLAVDVSLLFFTLVFFLLAKKMNEKTK